MVGWNGTADWRDVKKTTADEESSEASRFPSSMLNGA